MAYVRPGDEHNFAPNSNAGRILGKIATVRQAKGLEKKKEENNMNNNKESKNIVNIIKNNLKKNFSPNNIKTSEVKDEGKGLGSKSLKQEPNVKSDKQAPYSKSEKQDPRLKTDKTHPDVKLEKKEFGLKSEKQENKCKSEAWNSMKGENLSSNKHVKQELKQEDDDEIGEDLFQFGSKSIKNEAKVDSANEDTSEKESASGRFTAKGLKLER